MSPAHVPSNGTPAKKPQALQACPTRSGSPPTQPRKGELAVPEWGRCRCRGGRTGGRVKDALFGQICTSRSHFPRSLFLKVQICPNQCTHPAHAPDAPRSRPILRCPTVQKTGRFAPQPPVSPARATQNTQSADFLYLPHQKQAPTGQSAPVPPRHRSPPRLTATAKQSASYRLSGNSTVTRHPSPSLRTLTVP